MRLLIPTSDANGPESRMSGHFGRAPYYAVADTETGTVLSVANPSVTHGHGECVPATDAIGAGAFGADDGCGGSGGCGGRGEHRLDD
jgi:predicted Fe-Mo cluster-binding NifX family protein